MLNHSGIVQLMGICINIPDLFLVTELVEGSSLEEILHVERRKLSDLDMLAISVQVSLSLSLSAKLTHLRLGVCVCVRARMCAYVCVCVIVCVRLTGPAWRRASMLNENIS